MKDIKICGILVLYNNLSDTETIVQAIVNQTVIVQQLIVVDNSEEEKAIENVALLNNFDKYITIKYVKTKENIGSAGGYALGMELALNGDFDLIWLNDQDGNPEIHCLEKLMEYYINCNCKVAIYCPCIISIKNKLPLDYFRSKTNVFLNGISWDIREGNSVDVAGSTGLLISRKIIETIGVYNYEVCFVGNEDREYSLRSKRNGFNIYLVNNAKYFHPDLFEKYNKSNRNRVANLMQKCIPWYLGSITTKNKRNSKMCISSAYISFAYGNYFGRWVNYWYSIFRTGVAAIISKDVDLHETRNCYELGKYKATSEFKNEVRIADYIKWISGETNEKV